MTKTKAAFLLLIAFLTIRCADRDVPEDTPACIRKKIRQFNRGAACDAGASVTQYIFQGRTIYVFNPGNCGYDMSAAVVDRDCNDICSLDGQIT